MKKTKLTKLLVVFVILTLSLCFSSVALAADSGDNDYSLMLLGYDYTIVYSNNFTPAAYVEDEKTSFIPPSFTLKSAADCGFTRIGYLFQGWDDNDADGAVDYEAGDTFTFNASGGGSIQLWAVWSKIDFQLPLLPVFPLYEYTVTYHCNFTPAVPNAIDGSNEYNHVYTAKPANTFDHPLLLMFFMGWSTEEDGDVVYEPGDTFKIPTEYVRTKKNMDLWAVWDRLVFELPTPTLDRVNHYAYMQGYPAGDFGIYKNMTRAEAVVMFSRLTTDVIDDKEMGGYKYASTYTDVPQGQWYSNAIGYMQQSGVLSTPSPYFRPNDNITRAEFADLVCGFENLTTGSPNSFTDVPSWHPYYDQINYAVARGWLTGYPDGSFRPNNPIYRSEVVAVVNRVLERYPDVNYIDTNYSSLKHYTDLNTDFWAYDHIMEASNHVGGAAGVPHGHLYSKPTSTSETWTSLF